MNGHTLLLRQIHPSFFPNGIVSSQAFVPFPKDDGKLSIDDGDQITAKDSYKHYTVNLQLESVGVWAVTGAEVVSTGLAYRSDPVDDNPAHTIIDFGDRAEKECRKLAKRLKKFAVDRGSLYRGT
ncbi:MAG: hypothetical protein KF890_03965 [Nitrospira sp.]|nr:hypothetical protein [Nitrospira sp.]